MIRQLLFCFIVAETAAEDNNYEYGDIFDYLSGNLTSDEYFERETSSGVYE